MTATASSGVSTDIEQQLLLQGNAYDNFINAIRAQATQDLYNFALRKFMSYHNKQHVGDLLSYDVRLIEAKIIEWVVHLKKEQGYDHINLKKQRED